MATPKLLKALNLISDNEWQSYKKLILQQTQKNSQVYQLCQRLYNQRSQLQKKDYDKVIHKKYYSELTSKAFKNLLSKLFSSFEDWLAQESFRNERYAKELQLIKAYNQRGLFKLADQTAAKLETKIKSEKYLGLDRNKSLAQLYHCQYYSSNPIKRKKSSTLFEDCLTHFIHTTKEYATGYLIELENQARTRNIQHASLKEILSKLQGAAYTTELNDILGHAYKMFCKNDKAAYLRLENILESEALDPASDLFLILTIYLRRVSGQLFQKQQIDTSQVITAYQLSFLATSENSNQKFLSRNLFNGVATLGTIMSYEDTEAFIDKWIDKVHTDDRQSALKYCQALNCFRNDSYESIPNLLQGLNFDFPSIKMESSLLLIIAHYKLGEEELTQNLIGNFKKQMKRNESKFSTQNYSSIKNLIIIIELLIKSKYNSSIVINLEDYDAIFYRSWVKKQLKK